MVRPITPANAEKYGEWRQAYLDGQSYRQIADDAGVGKSWVGEVLRREGIQRRRGVVSPYSDEEHARWESLYTSPMSAQKVADSCGVPTITVMKWLAKRGLTRR